MHREADLLTNRVPADLREPMRAAAKRCRTTRDEALAVTEDLVRDAVRSYFGDDPEAVIARAIIARRTEQNAATMAELDKSRKPRLREAG